VFPLLILSKENREGPHSINNHTSFCSFCAKIAWPVGGGSTGQEWIAADNYYARGGSSQVGLSHGICPECFDESQNRWRRN
jgi:hypothetical protein